MNKLSTLIAAGSLGLAATVAVADNHEMQGMDHSNMAGMDHSSMDMSAMPGHMQGFMGAMDTMMQNMPMESAGDVDADFLLMMIPHHQSAIDMARAAIEQGADDEATRAMAELIIESQEGEIAEMRAMLERMGVEPPAAPAE